MNIHQICVEHDPVEDRVLMRMNTHDKELIEIWLTRRIALQLMPALEQLNTELVAKQTGVSTPLMDQQSKKLMADLVHQRTLDQSNFSTPFQLFENLLTGPRPFLVTHLQASLFEHAGLRIELLEKIASSERQLELTLDNELLQGLQHLLTKSVDAAQWKQSVSLSLQDDGAWGSDFANSTLGQSGYLN